VHYIVTTTVAGRTPVFRDFAASVIVARELRAMDRSGACEVLAWVLMPDHLHMLVAMTHVELPALVGGLKGRTARLLNASLGRSGRLWQRGFHDHALRVEEDIVSAARYIVANPLRARLVEKIGEYPFWDARWVG
jgi:REP element-mobilizing transposase RayT